MTPYHNFVVKSTHMRHIPKNPAMAVRFVLSIAGFSHDMPPLRTFDNKMTSH